MSDRSMFDRILRAWFDLAAALLAVAIALFPPRWLTERFLRDQDLPILFAALLAAGFARIALGLAGGDRPLLRALAGSPAVRALAGPGPRLFVAGLALACGLVALAGAQVLFSGYALSMDEFMARFDAASLARGLLMAPVAPGWRPYETALQPQFVRSVARGAGWGSTYLPVNAALLALGGAFRAPALVQPVLAAVSVAATFAVGRRLWPERPGAAAGAAILLATSSQFLITAMTPYAMTAHLAFNLVWLWLFLRGGRRGHAGALGVGFLACGLHQLAFHPLFVAPFVLRLWLARRWRVAALYTIAYAGFCLFWISYDPLTQALFGSAARATAAHGAFDPNAFDSQAGALVGAFDPAAIGLMARNLIRFATWQNVLTVPLALAGALAALRARGAERSLVLGLVLTPAAMFVLMPYQGHGWGYRYMHGLLGSACLLAAWTWSRLAEALDAEERIGARGLFAAAAAVSLLGVFPVRALQAHRFAHPYVRADRAIRQARADVVLVDDTASLFTIDLVRNDPFLRNRPIVMWARGVRGDQLGALCARYRIAVFDRADAAAFGIHTFTPPALSSQAADRRAFMAAATCGRAQVPIRDLGGRSPR